MRALVIKKPGEASIESIPAPVAANGSVLLKVRMGGILRE
jgi:hypothetical protein